MTRLATIVLIFAVIRQSLKLKEQIDQETQDYCYALTLLFCLDFITTWFDQYSKYFAGGRGKALDRKKIGASLLEHCDSLQQLNYRKAF